MSEQLDLPKFHLDPGMDHLPAHHYHRQYGKSLHFSPERVVMMTMYMIIRQHRPMLHLFEVIRIRFDWMDGFSPVLEIEGVYLEKFKIKGSTKASHYMNPKENVSWRTAVRSAVAKFPGHNARVLMYGRKMELDKEAANVQTALQLLEPPKRAAT